MTTRTEARIEEATTAPGGVCQYRRIKAGRLCSADAVALLAGMCVHEHLRESLYCAAHAPIPRRGECICETCWYGDKPHRCPVTAIAESAVSA